MMMMMMMMMMILPLKKGRTTIVEETIVCPFDFLMLESTFLDCCIGLGSKLDWSPPHTPTHSTLVSSLVTTTIVGANISNPKQTSTKHFGYCIS